MQRNNAELSQKPLRETIAYQMVH